MAFNRKDRERRGRRDPFAHLRDERAQAETGDAWFLAPDEGPELDVQAGISSNLDQNDLGRLPERPSPGPGRPEQHDGHERQEQPERPRMPERFDRPAHAQQPVHRPDKATEHPRPEPPMAISLPPAPSSAPVEPPPVARAEPPMTQIQPVVVPPPAPPVMPAPPAPLAPAPPAPSEPPATQLQPAVTHDDEPLARRAPEPVAPEPAPPSFTAPKLTPPEPIPLFAEPFDFGSSDGKASSPDDPVDYASEVGLDVLSAAVAALGRNKPSDERRDDVPATTQEMATVDESDAATDDTAQTEPEAD